MSSSSPALESAWQTLRSSLDGAQAFGLVFVFSDDARAKEALFQRAQDWMQMQVRPFQRPAVPAAQAMLTELLPLAVNPASKQAQAGLPLWLDLDGHAGDHAWDEARQTFLLRLNERRAMLVREHPRTVVLALPLGWTKTAAEAAPDLWTIRQPSVYLETLAAQPGPERLRGVTDEAGEKDPTPSLELPATVQRWQAAQRGHQPSLSAWSAARAAEAALESGHVDLAWDIANETVTRIRTSIDAMGRTPERLRDLSIALDKLGDVAQALGRLDEAQSAYAEGETLARALIDGFGRSPERLRDLSVSLEKRGNVAQALGRLDEAQRAYAEGESLARALIDEFGRTPERLRDLSVSLNKRGDVAQALGRLDEAQHAYAESESLARALIDEFGRTPERLRDLSVSLNKWGNVTQALGRLDEAQRAYAEGETLRRALIEEFGRTPERLRDLSVSLEKRGNVAQALGRLDEAQRWFAAEVATAEDLIDHYGESAGALEVLAYGEMGLGQTLKLSNQPDQAKPHLDRARRLYQRLAIALPHDPRYSAALANLDQQT